ncbi:TPA: hypothetical protein ACJ5DT_001889 [Legionella pneumophila]|uniref:Uncharacterized protein n=1 Tax=Legionella pneumophila TaxID=446 RepID=A0A2S6F5Z8_LEGPN|nr:hypothetical protein [Legionella pneumophila]APF02358.1 hypothetical protein BIZ52_02830 [Legionella pneumophila subsp. fraseri]APF05368.1 hypothetical protein BIZ51_02830 [Legionella pneumophila subsp. fraseri]AUB67841.1 hypothetical protein BJK09_02835 [Legionella pneumophila]AUB70812.1 hypothetical protein BJK08_02835 [Legionella pneumophila]KXB27057.1 hypothetical protein PtVF66_02900 [Legionella pneumophila]
MADQPPKSKWHEIKRLSDGDNKVDNNQAPVSTADRIKKLYLDTQVGSPIDTVEEADAQRNNFGPKDTKIENSSLENDEPNPDIPTPG